MPLRPCLGSAAYPQGHTLTQGSRCPTCQALAQRGKDARRPARRSAAETRRRREAVAAHMATYGWWCPGDARHQAHASTDLTADHIIAVAAGGREDGPLRVLCRPGNSARGARRA